MNIRTLYKIFLVMNKCLKIISIREKENLLGCNELFVVVGEPGSTPGPDHEKIFQCKFTLRRYLSVLFGCFMSQDIFLSNNIA